jgi:hypothetical protein
MLSQYIANLQNLLQLPGAPVSLYSTANLTLWINIGRGQVAAEGECVRVIGTLPTVPGQRSYDFTDINIGVPSASGVQGVLHVRRLQYAVATGQKWVNHKSWEWFDAYRLNNPVPEAGWPIEWAQYGQGSAGAQITAGGGSVTSGSLYIDPPPDLIYELFPDCVCYPIALASDDDPEAIPYLFTDAVPYFAAYMALMTAQTGQRVQEAQQMKQLYSEFMQRARAASTAAVDRTLYEQVPDAANPMQAGRQGGGMAPAGGGG